jgi:ABC-type transport system involved in multi-copper enzyme maturation permease subunit
MAGATTTVKMSKGRKAAQVRADAAPKGADPATKLHDMLHSIPTKGRALLEMTVQNIFYDKKALIFFGLALFLLVIPGYWAYTWTPKSPGGLEMFVIVTMMIYLQFIVIYACLLFGTSQFAEEEEQRTITYLTSRPLSNVELVIYKYIGFVLSIFFMFIIPVLLNFAIICTHTSYDITSGFMFHLGQFIGLMFVAIAAWGAFFMLLGVALKKYALIAGLLYALFWETFVANIPNGIRYATVNHYIRSISPYYVSFGVTGAGAASPWAQALATMIVFSIVCLVLSWYAQRNKDLN